MQVVELIEDHESRVREMVTLAHPLDGTSERALVMKGWNAALEAVRKRTPGWRSLAEMLDALKDGKDVPKLDEHTGERKMREAQEVREQTHAAMDARIDNLEAAIKRSTRAAVQSYDQLQKVDAQQGQTLNELLRRMQALDVQVHDLQRWQHTGEAPRGFDPTSTSGKVELLRVQVDNYQRAHNELNSVVCKRAGQLDTMAENQWAQETRLSKQEALTHALGELAQKHERELALSRACMNVKPQDLGSFYNPLDVQAQMQERAKADNLAMLRHQAGVSLDEQMSHNQVHPSAYRQPGQPAPEHDRGQPGVHPSAYEQPGRR